MMNSADEGDGFETADEQLMDQIDREIKGGVHNHFALETRFLPGVDEGDWHEQSRLLSEDDTDDDYSVGRIINGDTYTVEDAVESMGFGWFQIKVFVVCGLFSATDALEMLLLSVLSPELRCEWGLSEFEIPLMTTFVFVGMFVGSSLWGSWADKYGRWMICFLAAIWICYYGVMTAFSPNYLWIIVLRALVGAGFGGAVQSFTLMAEYIPSKYRAKVLIIYNLTWALGSCFEIWLAYFTLPTLGWRYLVAFSALPSFITLFFLWGLPESARFLVAAGRKKEAAKVLEQACQDNGKVLPPGELINTQSAPRGRLLDLFGSQYARTTLQLWLLWFGTAYSYYGVVLLSSEILEDANYCGADSKVDIEVDEACHCKLHNRADYVTMIIATFGEFFAIPFNLLTIDMLGRRATLAICFGASGVFFLLIQICTSRIGLTIFIFGVRAFTSGIFNVIYIYTTEVYPTTVRSLGLGTSSAMARVGAMVTPFFAQTMLQQSVPATVWVYGVIAFACAINAILLPIETKGREMMQTAGR